MIHLVIPDPTPCLTCKGDGEVTTVLRDEGGAVIGLQHRVCPECCCDRCGTDVYTRGDGPQLCNDCAEEETWPTNPIPAGLTANQRTHDEPTSTFPTRVGSGTQQPDAEWDLAERTYERRCDQ